MSLAVPPPFLPAPGRPVIPWKEWRRVLQNYLLASGGDAHGPARRKALLPHCFGVEGHIVFYTLSETHPPVPLQETTAGMKPPTVVDEYDVPLADMETFFAATLNVIVARHRFRQRAQLPGESVEVFVAELRDLSADCEFGLLADEFIRDQLVAETRSQQLRECLLLEGSILTLDRSLSIGRLVDEAVRYFKQLVSSSSVQEVDVKSPKAAELAKQGDKLANQAAKLAKEATELPKQEAKLAKQATQLAKQEAKLAKQEAQPAKQAKLRARQVKLIAELALLVFELFKMVTEQITLMIKLLFKLAVKLFKTLHIPKKGYGLYELPSSLLCSVTQ
ncbi:uncharacterized protein LOC115325139 [Ixodes scapularis]|uniref:uncharacterized protein LOC115325139 n=1 Tax=Ixodes scapularis TaxID=6945 RepID=UPI001A9FBB21|nr:uncharacterized protein LOC115325139 [Ixodes scapularis]